MSVCTCARACVCVCVRVRVRVTSMSVMDWSCMVGPRAFGEAAADKALSLQVMNRQWHVTYEGRPRYHTFKSALKVLFTYGAGSI